MTRGAESLTVRAAEPADRDRILELLAASLGWAVDDDFRRYFEWKHLSSPWGPSPAWLAFHADTLVGYRAFLRWELESATGERLAAARAVDAATRPEAWGRGVFTALTAHAVAALRDAGTQVIFTTPNDNAGAGWIKAGAQLVGRLPISVRPRSPLALARLLRSRGAADRWPIASEAGQPAALTVADPRVEALLDALPPPVGLRTRRSVEFLRWRYGFAPLGYRTLTIDGDPANGLAIFRVRRRGAAREAVLCDVLTPQGSGRVAAALARRVASASRADYVLKVRAGRPLDSTGSVALPGQGPKLYALSLRPGLDVGALEHWSLVLGDAELL